MALIKMLKMQLNLELNTTISTTVLTVGIISEAKAQGYENERTRQ